MVMRFVRHYRGPTKLLVRAAGLATIALLSFCGIVYLTWSLPGLSSRTTLTSFLPKTTAKEVKIRWNDAPRRVIVFGDSWSDNGHYPVDPPGQGQSSTRDAAQGKVWTEWLCAAISCTHHDNFARSLPQLWESGYSGAVVDSNLLNTTMVASSNATILNSSIILALGTAEPLADMKTQVQQWLGFEKQQYDNTRVKKIERSRTIFTVWFSFWDLWYYSEKTVAEAEVAITKTMDTLFEQLDLIAENWPLEMKVIIPEAIDTTFLPGWQSVKTGPKGSDPQGAIQRNAVILVEQWNRALDMRATRWNKGSMYIYNTNEWLLDQVREHELYSMKMSDANGVGINKPPWENVRSACVEFERGASDVKGFTQCSDPKGYLFWDDMHLGPEAMRMIGESIANDIASIHDDSWFANDVVARYEDSDDGGSNGTPTLSPDGKSSPSKG